MILTSDLLWEGLLELLWVAALGWLVEDSHFFPVEAVVPRLVH